MHLKCILTFVDTLVSLSSRDVNSHLSSYSLGEMGRISLHCDHTQSWRNILPAGALKKGKGKFRTSQLSEFLISFALRCIPFFIFRYIITFLLCEGIRLPNARSPFTSSLNFFNVSFHALHVHDGNVILSSFHFGT